VTADLALEIAGETDLDYVETLLEDEGLPSADVRSGPAEFYVATAGTERVGVGGIEHAGSAGLLRSVVVEPRLRGRGYGRAVCERIEDRASADGIETLYLLTTTAVEAFGALGYVEVERAEAPADPRRTAQFEELCPASATLMRTDL